MSDQYQNLPGQISAPPESGGRRSRRALAYLVSGLAVFAVGTCAGFVVGRQSGDTTQQVAAAAATAPTVTQTVEVPGPTETIVVTPEPTRRVPPATGAHRKLTVRQWKLIVKDPDSHLGERYIIYGQVSQFDSATGPDSFLANVDAVRHSDPYEYEQNTLLTGEAADFTKVVEDDGFTAKVTVLGSMSYDTQIGGSTTVPMLMVDSVTVREG
jgi:hypothetical protein